ALRLATRFRQDGSVDVLERRPSGAWALFMTIPRGEVDAPRLLAFSADGKTLYLYDTRDRDKAALMAVDVATRRARVLVEDPAADVTRVALHRVTRQPLAAGAMVDRRRWYAVDPAFAADLKTIQSSTPGDIDQIGPSADGSRILVYIQHDAATPESLLSQRATRPV